MAKISADLEQKLKSEPERTVDLIVRTTSDARSYVEWCESVGLAVKRCFKLSPGLAVCGKAENALKLLDQDWVQSVELDQPVQAM